MITFVIDASIAIKWVVQETGTNQVLWPRRHRLIAPDLLIPECAKILWKKVRRGEVSAQVAIVSARILARSAIELEPMAALMEASTRFSILLGRAAYDCFYLALAQANGCDFITADDALRCKVQSAGLPVSIVLLNTINTLERPQLGSVPMP